MQQAQKMQENMASIQEEIKTMRVEGQSGGGLVKLTMNGRHQVVRIDIDDSLLGDDKDMLEDLVAAAVNDAAKKVELATKEKYKNMTGGLDLPAGFQMPF